MRAKVLVRRGTCSLLLGAISTTTGCGLGQQNQLEAVARDWCMTIRAGQVIPVYPLTEDVQPGDVFLVQVPVDRQQEVYRKRGFLPLDNHIARLDLSGYHAFYDHSVLASDGAGLTRLPAEWMRPEGGGDEWAAAPTAAFPTYAFSVRQGAGLNLAIPVSGVPIGLSLLGTRQAEGSVSIEKARTLGVDLISAFGDLQAWAVLHKDFLAAYGPATSAEPSNYLRVVTRVYITGKVDIALSDARSLAAGADAGVPRPVELLFPEPAAHADDTPRATIETYRKNLETLNSTLDRMPGAPADAGSTGALPAGPGGSVRVSAASARFISLQQDFDPPLVIGYLGFDVAIRGGGQIGPPIPTHAQIDPEAQGAAFIPQGVIEGLFAGGIGYLPMEDLKQAAEAGDPGAAEAVARLNALGRFVPDAAPVISQTDDGLAETTRPLPRDYDGFFEYRERLRINAAVIGRELAGTGPFTLRRGGESVAVVRGDEQWAALERRAAEWRRALEELDARSGHREAAMFAGAQYLRIVGERPGR
jgi:hypothetical protein